ncbi:hypothetical protein AALO_G00125130 [Alosa alosa]|uniref:Uncharacterized protein n=1 Tax=Alosa alosa TaxID=278164 RepID=A0AAV6GL32_9TELE|nr:hypothetical protein AALO_G00125130 [Alosa alosa]
MFLIGLFDRVSILAERFHFKLYNFQKSIKLHYFLYWFYRLQDVCEICTVKVLYFDCNCLCILIRFFIRIMSGF